MGLTESQMKEKHSKALCIHKKRRRTVIGCMHCSQEILPDTGFSKDKFCGLAYVCGTCREATYFCLKCVKELQSSNTKSSFVLVHKRKEILMLQESSTDVQHRLFLEKLDLHVDVDEIRKMCREDSNFCSAEIFREYFKIYHQRWLIGELKENLDTSLSSEYSWKSYEEVYKESMNAFKACRDLYGLSYFNEKKSNENQFCIVVGAASRLWYLAYFALALNGYGIVPMPGTSTSKQLRYVYEKVKPKVVFISIHVENFLTEEDDCGIVYLNDSEKKYEHIRLRTNPKEQLLKKGISWKELISHGEKIKEEIKFIKKEYNKAATKLLLSSSGTTGMPKLVMLSDGMIKKGFGPPRQGILTVMLSLKPLRQCWDVIAKGGRIGCFSSLCTLSKDLQLVRPSLFGSTPAFFISYFDQFKVELEEEIKKEKLKDKPRDDDLVKKQLNNTWTKRNILGNRCKFVIVGGAVSSKELKDFIFEALGSVVIDGYGTTETGAVSSSGRVLEGVKMLLIDAPEYGYTTSDEPNPRGEIVVRTSRMTSGYYGDEEATKKQFVKIGGFKYSRTGDIGEVKNGRVEIIDRVKSLFKLSNGIFVAPSPLECIFENSPFVQRVFVWANSKMPFISCAVILSEKKDNKKQSDDDEQIKEKVKKDFERLAKENDLSSSYIPRVIHLDVEPWTEENGLINPAGKRIRSALISKYKNKLLDESKKLLENSNIPEIEHNVEKKQKQTKKTDLSSGLVKLIGNCIPRFNEENLSNGCLTSKTCLYELGADSLTFARIVGEIRSKFSSKMTLPQLMSCETMGDVQRAMFGDIVKKEAKEKTEQFFVEEVQKGIKKLKEICKEREIFEKTKTKKTVLLTGARGFLGSFILSELCKKDFRVICVVRKKKDVSPKKSILTVLEKFKLEKFEKRWDAIEGDISMFNFGIKKPEETYKKIGEKIGGHPYPNIILHCAASVGSASPYSSLIPHNIDGTIHALNIAYKYKSRFVYISTVGFLPGDLEDLTQVKISAKRLPHLGTYAQSKWVAERIVLDNNVLSKRLVSVVRVGTCFGARNTGCANEKDSVIRLIAGLAKEKVYCIGENSPLPSFFRLVPVDLVAEEIIKTHLDHLIKGKNNESPRISTAMTLHETSLIEIIESMKKCGVKLTEITSEEFRERMKNVSVGDSNHPLYVYSSTLSSSGFATDSSQKFEKKEKHGNTIDLDATIKWVINNFK